MSSVSFYAGSKAENAAYLAFGISLGLALLRWLVPDAFGDLQTALSLAILCGSILGSLAFYLKPERVVTWLLRRRVIKKRGLEIYNFIITASLCLEAWRWSLTSDWDEPNERTPYILHRVTESSELHDDVWALKGVFFFVWAVLFLLFSTGIDILLVLLLTGALNCLVLVAIYYNYQGFLVRCSRVAMFLFLRETLSVFRLRDDATRPYVNPLLGPSNSRSPLEPLIDELETMLENRDWRGFLSRYHYVEEDFAEQLERIKPKLSIYFVDIWAAAHHEFKEEERRKKLVSTKVLKQMVEYVTRNGLVDLTTELETLLKVDDKDLEIPIMLFKTVVNVGAAKDFEDSIQKAFRKVTKDSAADNLTSIALNLYISGYESLGSSLLIAAESLSDEDLRDKVVQALLPIEDPPVWTNAGPRTACALTSLNEELTKSALIQIINRGKREAKLELLPKLNAHNYSIAEALLPLARSGDEEIRSRAVTLFRSAHIDVMTGHLIPELMLLEEPARRIDLVFFLGSLCAFDPQMLEGNREKQRRRALKPFLVEALLDGDSRVRMAAVDALVYSKPTKEEQRNLQIIVDADSNRDVVLHTRKMLRKIHDGTLYE